MNWVFPYNEWNGPDECVYTDEYDWYLLIAAAIVDVAAWEDRIKYYWFNSAIVEFHK